MRVLWSLIAGLIFGAGLVISGMSNPAKVMQLEGYGLDVGNNADMVLLQAANPIEAIRLKARRLAVIRRGRVIAKTPAQITSLSLEGRPRQLDQADYRPRET